MMPINPYCLFIDNITALEEVWIVGDEIVNDGLKHLLPLRKEFDNNTRSL